MYFTYLGAPCDLIYIHTVKWASAVEVVIIQSPHAVSILYV